MFIFILLNFGSFGFFPERRLSNAPAIKSTINAPKITAPNSIPITNIKGKNNANAILHLVGIMGLSIIFSLLVWT